MKHRLFIALDLLPAQKDQILALQQELAKLAVPITWELPEKLHLTLNFIGRVEDSTASQLMKLLPRWSLAIPAFSLTLGFLETLYRRHEPSLIYLGPSDGLTAVRELQAYLNNELGQMTLPQQDRFLPHVTIGQLPRTDPTTTKQQLDKFANYHFQPLLPFAVKHISLYESFLTKAGSHFTYLGQFPLGH